MCVLRARRNHCVTSHEKLDALLKPLIREAVLLEPSRSKAAEAASANSKFGGLPYATQGDPWPLCPSCGRELVFVAQFLDDKTQTLYAFFYCFACFPWEVGAEENAQWLVRRYPGPSMEHYRKLQPCAPDKQTVIPCTVSRSPVRVLPDWEGIESRCMTASNLCYDLDDARPWEEYAAAILRLGCLNEYATLVGGYPRWVQDALVTSCESCGSELEFLAQLDSEEAAGLMWGDAGLVYLFQCPNHPDVFHLELQCH
jgi:hypothetical protein